MSQVSFIKGAFCDSYDNGFLPLNDWLSVIRWFGVLTCCYQKFGKWKKLPHSSLSGRLRKSGKGRFIFKAPPSYHPSVNDVELHHLPMVKWVSGQVMLLSNYYPNCQCGKLFPLSLIIGLANAQLGPKCVSVEWFKCEIKPPRLILRVQFLFGVQPRTKAAQHDCPYFIQKMQVQNYFSHEFLLLEMKHCHIHLCELLS